MLYAIAMGQIIIIVRKKKVFCKKKTVFFLLEMLEMKLRTGEFRLQLV